ncbi:hypothetical protein [Haladaptatus sp. CMAA 1911]|uniref:hypothetical protein n=1 Tax=unclassified Haladaptatus TaxID=2622732 RepID=UPI003754EA9E
MNRRRFTALLGLVGSSAGCIGRLPTDGGDDDAEPVSLRVRNFFEKRRVVTVSIEGTRTGDHYKSKFYLFPGWIENRQNILEADTYEVNVELDNDMWRTVEWKMNGCETNVILIDVGPDGIGVTSTCQEEMTETATATETETAETEPTMEPGTATKTGIATETRTTNGTETN